MAPMSTRSSTAPQRSTEDQALRAATNPQDVDSHAGLTQEQRNARFALEQRKLEADLAKVEADRAAIEARTARENEESRARITAIQAGPAVARTPTAAEEEDSTGEVPQAALLVASHHPGLPKAEIARIFSNKFRPQNLFKPRHLKGREDRDREENNTIENGTMKLKKSTVNLDDFGSSSEIWSEGFLNYVMVMSDFFGSAFPSLVRVLLRFHNKIKMLSKIYDWRNAVIPLAIDYHTEVTTGNHTDVEAWALPQHWVDTYCTPQYVSSSSFSGQIGRSSKTRGNYQDHQLTSARRIYRRKHGGRRLHRTHQSHYDTPGCSQSEALTPSKS